MRAISLVAALVGLVLPCASQSSPAPIPLIQARGVFQPFEMIVPTMAHAPGGLNEASRSPNNPWLDFRMHAWCFAPSGRILQVPGFYAADGFGGDAGSAWKLRITPDEIGLWAVALRFERGSRLNVRDLSVPGTRVFPDSHLVLMWVGGMPPEARGFHRKGPLEAVGARYLRHRDGTWFLKTGTNSPENLLGYAGFDGARDLGGLPGGGSFLHTFEPHVRDWRSGDPNWSSGGDRNAGKGMIGAVNYLADRGVNSLYFLPLNLGGDGQDTFPFLDPSGRAFEKVTHYDVGRMEQWNAVFTHAQRLGMLLEFVLAEQENENINWLGPGLTDARRLFLKTMVAMFGHHPGVRWILCEENAPEPNDEFSVQELSQFAQWIQQWSTMRHPIAVHTTPDDQRIFEQILQSSHPNQWLTSASLQVHSNYNPATESATELFERFGQAATVDLDELGPSGVGVAPWNQDEVRKLVLWDVLLSGGNISWYAGYHALPVGGDIRLEDFRTREATWDASRRARELLELVPFWRMRAADDLVTGDTRDRAYGDAEVFAADGEVYVIYFANARSTGSLDLSTSPSERRFEARWFDPRHGGLSAVAATLRGGLVEDLPSAPAPTGEDWVLLVTRR